MARATPEGRVKDSIDRCLNKYKHVYRFMPVQMGYGAPSLDYLVCVRGRFLGIEAKAPGKKPTPRQEETIRQIVSAGGTVLVIDGDMAPLNAYLSTHTERYESDRIENPQGSRGPRNTGGHADVSKRAPAAGQQQTRR